MNTQSKEFEAFEEWWTGKDGWAPLDGARPISMRAWQASRAQALGEADKQLCEFYGVSTYPELVNAQLHHIVKLQEKQKSAYPYITKSRFA